MVSLTDKANFGLIAATASAVLWMFATFASSAEVDDLRLDILYGQFFDRLDDYEEELEQDDQVSAERLKRELIRIKAKICEANPKFEYCNESI